jgi:hypothetical protein
LARELTILLLAKGHQAAPNNAHKAHQPSAVSLYIHYFPSIEVLGDADEESRRISLAHI